MSLLTIVQSVTRELGLPTPSSSAGVVTNTDNTVQQLYALVNREGKQLASDAQWQALQTRATVTLVDGTAGYSLASDFDRFIDRTMWDNTRHWELLGPESPQAWEWFKNGIVATGPRRRWRFFGNRFTIHPTPGSGDAGVVLYYEYISNQWCTDSTGNTGKTAMTADDDVSKLSEDIIVMGVKLRFFAIKGMDTTELRREYEAQKSQVIARDGGAPTLSLTRRKWPIYISPANVPESGFGS